MSENSEREAIPDGVYYNDGNFYSVAERKGMGWDFFNKWQSRRSEFPTSPALTQGEGSEPVGWRLVPVEPTEAMSDAGEHIMETEGYVKHARPADFAYKAMLAAAPSPPSLPAGNADPRVREALEKAFELACKAACDSCARGYPIDDGDDGVLTRNGRYHPNRNYSNTGFGGGFHECKAADARVAFKAALSALPSPQSQGLVEAAELSEVRVFSFRDEPHVVLYFKRAEEARRIGMALRQEVRARASDRSA